MLLTERTFTLTLHINTISYNVVNILYIEVHIISSLVCDPFNVIR
jgi:hypothetical protein